MSNRSPRTEQPAASASASADILFRGHAHWLRAVLRRRFGPDVAEDLVQDTYLRVVGSADAAAIRQPRPFLYRVASNLAVDRLRQAARRPSLEPLDEGQGLPWHACNQDQVLLLKQIILDLPAPQREVFLLNRVGGLTYESIARHLNISVKTVEWRMSRVLARCAERLGE